MHQLSQQTLLTLLTSQMKDPWLLPFLLPNVFAIATSKTKDEFNAVTLPALRPLFALTDPPQNMLTLLDSMPLFVEKTTPAVFRECSSAPSLSLPTSAAPEGMLMSNEGGEDRRHAARVPRA